jgi:alkylation response protein AidB-like acyl-CoA dehydrogenase
MYCARATRTVCETAVQVHGGIGNTWECLVHVYLRRALTSTELWPVTLKEIDLGLS